MNFFGPFHLLTAHFTVPVCRRADARGNRHSRRRCRPPAGRSPCPAIRATAATWSCPRLRPARAPIMPRSTGISATCARSTRSTRTTRARRRFATYYRPPSIADYLQTAWTDFSQHQVQPFGDMPFFLGIGNHELIAPKTRNQFLIEFESLLDQPELQGSSAAKDAALLAALNSRRMARTYYHWIERGVDFINLDNATDDAFDVAQLAWFDAVVDCRSRRQAHHDDRSRHARVAAVQQVRRPQHVHEHERTHAAACMSTRGSRRRTRRGMCTCCRAIRISTSPMPTTPSTGAIAANGGVVLPGWVIGTAGAERYALPAEVTPGADAREHVYGYLTGTVAPDGRSPLRSTNSSKPSCRQCARRTTTPRMSRSASL